MYQYYDDVELPEKEEPSAHTLEQRMLWIYRILGAIVILLVLAGLFRVGQLSTNAINEVETNRKNDLITRSISCLNILVDNDRFFSMPAACLADQVVTFYPLEVCEKYSDALAAAESLDSCGVRVDEVPSYGVVGFILS